MVSALSRHMLWRSLHWHKSSHFNIFTFIDILPILKAASQGLTPEKVEGMAVTDEGIVINNDNDGTDDYNGATYVSALPLILMPDD